MTSTPPCKSHQNWQSGQDENHIFRVKSKIGKISKGVDYLIKKQQQQQQQQQQGIKEKEERE